MPIPMPCSMSVGSCSGRCCTACEQRIQTSAYAWL